MSQWIVFTGYPVDSTASSHMKPYEESNRRMSTTMVNRPNWSLNGRNEEGETRARYLSDFIKRLHY